MKIYGSSQYIESPKIGDLQLRVNSMWNFSSRDVCFQSIEKTIGKGNIIISYDLERCIDVTDGIIIGGTQKVKNTKWKEAEITKGIAEQLINDGYTINKNYLTILN